MSDDGRFVVFESSARDLVERPRCKRCIYVHDRQTGATTRVSVSPTGDGPNRKAFYPDISGNGRYVSYATRASNLVADDDNDNFDVFVFDRHTGTTELVTRNPEGDPANGGSLRSRLSTDGRFVLYESAARDLVPGEDTNRAHDVFLTDRTAGTTVVVSVRPDGQRPKRRPSAPLDLSDDGRILLYRSQADDIVPGDDNRLYDVFAYDIETGATALISRAPDGTVAAGNSGSGSISSDGRYVAFASSASDIVTPDPLGHFDVFRFDRLTGDMQLVTRGVDGEPANAWSGYPTLSSDGHEIGFASDATDLIAGEDLGQVRNLFAVRLPDGAFELLTKGRAGAPPDASTSDSMLSGNGDVVVYASIATNLVRRDFNDASDVFVYRRR